MKKINLFQQDFLEVSHNPRVKKQVMIPFGELLPIVQFSRAVFPPGESAPAHRHADMAEVFLVQSGEGRICVDGEPVAVRAGDCVTVLPGELHEVGNVGSDDLVVLFFGVKTNPVE